MNYKRLPYTITIENTVYNIRTDFRDVLEVFEALNDPDLLNSERIEVGLYLFYIETIPTAHIHQAIREMFNFLTMGEYDETESSHNTEIPMYDWEQDFNIIIAPINKTLGKDVRSLEYLHWWTFLSAFMEIGECTFSTYVSIRNKLNKHKKLEKYEKDILKEHRKDIVLKKKVDSTTQSLMNEILGV